VSTGRRWYLVAYDLDREDWRTFRVDRVSDPFATGARFAPRELPTGDAAEYLRQSMYGWQRTYELDVTFAAPADFIAARLPKWLGAPEPLDDQSCRLRAAVGDSVEWMAVRLAMVDCEFTVHAPAELVQCVRDLGGRLSRAASR
jgi:predicted DNA-binding transcriptional regulator YafY